MYNIEEKNIRNNIPGSEIPPRANYIQKNATDALNYIRIRCWSVVSGQHNDISSGKMRWPKVERTSWLLANVLRCSLVAKVRLLGATGWTIVFQFFRVNTRQCLFRLCVHHTPSIAFRHLPPRKDVVTQCLEFVCVQHVFEIVVCTRQRSHVRLWTRESLTSGGVKAHIIMAAEWYKIEE